MAHIIVKCQGQQQVGMQFDDLEVGRHRHRYFDDAIQQASGPMCGGPDEASLEMD